MTRPDPAPDAHAPAEPILHRRLAKAIGLSLARNVSTERLLMSETCVTLPGKASIGCTAKAPARRSEKECMIVRVVKAMRLEKLLNLAARQEGECRKRSPSYSLPLCLCEQ